MTDGTPTPEQQRPDPVALPEGSPPQPRATFFQRIPPAPFAVLSLAIIFFLYQFVAGGATLLISRGTITSDNVQLIRWATMVGELLFILVPTLVLARLRGVRVLGYFRFHVPDYREIIATIIGVFSLQQMFQAYMMAQDALPLPSRVQQFVDYIRKMLEETYKVLLDSHSPSEFLFVVLVVALVPAVAEEFLFRGLIQRSLEEAAGGIRGAIVAGVIFGVYHLNPFSLIPLIGLGIYFGFIVYRSGNISLSISAHFFNNFLACVAAYLQMSDTFVAIAPAGAPSTFLTIANFVLFGIVFVAATYYFIRITERAPHIEG